MVGGDVAATEKHVWLVPEAMIRAKLLNNIAAVCSFALSRGVNDGPKSGHDVGATTSNWC